MFTDVARTAWLNHFKTMTYWAIMQNRGSRFYTPWNSMGKAREIADGDSMI